MCGRVFRRDGYLVHAHTDGRYVVGREELGRLWRYKREQQIAACAFPTDKLSPPVRRSLGFPAGLGKDSTQHNATTPVNLGRREESKDYAMDG